MPTLSPEVYQARYRKLESVRKQQGYDCLFIYADREHYANLRWLTGFDPRFEEALWIQGPSDKPVLIVGNECYDMARTQVQLDAEIWLYHPGPVGTAVRTGLGAAGLMIEVDAIAVVD